MDTFQHASSLCSLALSVPTIWLAIFTCCVFFREARQGFNRLRADGPDPVQWFAMGVFLGFLGSAVDNIYWMAAWHAEYMELDSSYILFHSGSISNMVFRQGAGCLAAYCHLRAAVEYSDHDQGRLVPHMLAAAVVSTCYAAYLIAKW